jgi:hypothetical protein
MDLTNELLNLFYSINQTKRWAMCTQELSLKIFPNSIIVCPIFFAQKPWLEAKGEPFLDYYFGNKIFYMGNIKNNAN